MRDQLTQEMIDAGKNLTERLDRHDLGVIAAMWFYLSDEDEWRLVVAFPKLDTDPKAAYAEVQSALPEDPDTGARLSLRNITVVSPSDSLLVALRTVAPTGPGISGIRATRNRINNVFVDDAYIYRMM